jgi:hypothetical protein
VATLVDGEPRAIVLRTGTQAVLKHTAAAVFFARPDESTVALRASEVVGLDESVEEREDEEDKLHRDVLHECEAAKIEAMEESNGLCAWVEKTLKWDGRGRKLMCWEAPTI